MKSRTVLISAKTSLIRALLAVVFMPLASAQTTPPPPATPATPAPKPAAIEAPDVAQNMENYFTFFSPFRTDRAAISPDGKHIAYTVRDGETLNVLVIASAEPSVIKNRVIVATDETSTPRMSELRGRIPASVIWMRWVSDTRLVVETNTQVVINNASYPGVISAIDIGNNDATVLVTARDIKQSTPNADKMLSSLAADANAQFRPGQNASADESALLFAAALNNSVTASSNDPFAFTTDPFGTTPDGTSTQESESPALGASATDMLAFTQNSPLSPHVFDLVANTPDAIYVRANSANNYYLYKLNTLTGSLKLDNEHIAPPETTPLLNRQGRPLLTIDNNSKKRFPFSYVYEKNSGPFARTSLDKLAGDKNAPHAPGFTLSPDNFFGSRAFPLGFDEDPAVLYYASNVNRDTYGIYSLNLKTGEPGSVAIENPSADLVLPSTGGYTENSPFIYDRYTRKLIGIRIEGIRPTIRWVHPTWQKLQALLEQTLRGRIVDIVEWDSSFTQFIVMSRSLVDPGAFHLFDARTNKLVQFATRTVAEMDNANAIPLPFNFDFANPNAPDSRINGTIIIPRRARTATLPVVVYCPTEPWRQPSAEYQAELRAIADMGFAVLQVNARGTWGSGTKNRLAAIEQGFDIVQTQDILAALDTLSKSFKINLKRVAIMGSARGGYLALRATQIAPDRFKCAVTINPTINLARWISSERWATGNTGPALTRPYYGTPERLRKNALENNVDSAKSPVLILSYPGALGAPRTQDFLDATQYKFALGRRDIPAEIYELSDDYMTGIYKARSEAYSKIETWLNEYIYRYKVDLGDMQRLGAETPSAQKPNIPKPEMPKLDIPKPPPPVIDLTK